MTRSAIIILEISGPEDETQDALDSIVQGLRFRSVGGVRVEAAAGHCLNAQARDVCAHLQAALAGVMNRDE